MALFEIENLKFTYNGATSPSLEGINLNVDSGEFILLCGESGCGKTTLLRLFKNQLRPEGKLEGVIKYDGSDIESLDEYRSACEIGFVMQNPDNQNVTDTVWSELAFGLENLGVESDEIRRRVAEVCGFFGIGEWYRKKICDLSGGQRQLLALASVMVMDPRVLILDEPTSQLDPITSMEFLNAVKRVNSQLGVTVIIAEHRLEDVFSMASRIILMDKSKIHLCDTPKNIGTHLSVGGGVHKLSVGMPSSVRLFAKFGGECECPIDVNEGKRYIRDNFNHQKTHLDTKAFETSDKVILEVKDAYFRYLRSSPDVLHGLCLKVYENEILCILGANGAGKTTLLKVLSGLYKPYSGKVLLLQKRLDKYTGNSLYRQNIAVLPQNPQDVFICDNVYDDLCRSVKFLGYKDEDAKRETDHMAKEMGIEGLYGMHPSDLSGGERQMVAFAKILLAKPQIILLDEPTKGLDAYSKIKFAKLLLSQKAKGKTIIMVTHDVEFAAEYSDRCATFFDGQIVSCTDRVTFFSSNRYYTTAIARMTRPYFENAVTVDMAIKLCEENGKKDG